MAPSGASSRRLAFATWAGQPALTEDDARAAEALRRAGHLVEPVVWDAPHVRWDGFDAVIVRSCWDYHRRPAEFLDWVGRVEAAGTPLFNPPAVLRWNHHKSYLRQVGVATVPTAWLERGAETDLRHLLADRGWAEAVVKPAISASAHETWVTSSATARADQPRLLALLEVGEVLVQPLLAEVRSPGEWSLVFFGGVFSHAMLKRPRAGDFRVQEELGGRADRMDPPPALVAGAARALAAAPAGCLYARVDGVEQAGGFVLMELELIEPVLYFGADPAAPGRFAAALPALRRVEEASHSPGE